MFWLDVKMRFSFLLGASFVWFPDYVLLVIQNQALFLFSVEPVFYLKYKSLALGNFRKTLLELALLDEYQKPGDWKTKLRKREIAIRI